VTFPVPKDVRGTRNFELILGTDEMLRQSIPLADEAADVDQGEWMKINASGQAAKLANGADVIATPALGAKVSWDTYRQANLDVGQSDALATKAVTLLSGTFQAKTKLYNTGSGVLDPGNLLVAVESGGQGILDALTPATADARQLQSVVGRIIGVADGQLHFEAPGL
jgi:hypothetical protein